MKIAFFGTPEFAGNILLGILEYSELEIVLVVSQPDKPVGRKKELFPTSVKQVSLDAGIQVMQPDKIKRNTQFHDSLRDLNLDFIIVVAYGKIIPQAILDIPKHGCVNIHGSILPKYRGASPVQAAIKSGDDETGLTTMYMSKGMDEGDILKIAKVEIDNMDTSEAIFKKFEHIGPGLLIETLREIMSGNLQGTPQDNSKSTHCGKISREDGEVFFSKQRSGEIYNTFRSYTPWPGIYTWYDGKRLVLEEVSLYNPPNSDYDSAPLIKGEDVTKGSRRIDTGNQEQIPGAFIKFSKNKYGIISADNKILEIKRVKLEGKKSMDTLSFVNGNREVMGYKFQ